LEEKNFAEGQHWLWEKKEEEWVGRIDGVRHLSWGFPLGYHRKLRGRQAFPKFPQDNFSTNLRHICIDGAGVALNFARFQL